MATRFVWVSWFCLASLNLCFAISLKDDNVILAMNLCWMLLNRMSAPFSIFFRRLMGANLVISSARILLLLFGAVAMGSSRIWRLFSLFFAGLL